MLISRVHAIKSFSNFFSCHSFPVIGPNTLAKIILFFSYKFLCTQILVCSTMGSRSSSSKKSFTKSTGSTSFNPSIFRTALPVNSRSTGKNSSLVHTFSILPFFRIFLVTHWRDHTSTTSSSNLSNYCTTRNHHLLPCKV